MKKILTITANPSIDKSMVAPKLVPDQKIQCKTIFVEPGGGGINISRAIKKLGGSSQTWFFAGGHTGNKLNDLVTKKELKHRSFPIKNDTRESFIVFENATSKQYLFNTEGPKILKKEWEHLLDSLNKSEPFDYIVASGSLPQGAPIRFFASLARIANEKGAKLILDTSGKALQAAMEIGVYMIKPNLLEFCQITGLKNPDIPALVEKCQEMISYNCCKVIVISLGEKGALVVSNDFWEHIPAPLVEKKSTVGAGDSMVAGIVLSLSEGKALRESVCFGVACGAAATLNPGSALCTREDCDRLYELI